MASADVVVLGAGPAGLMAAWRAARRGRSVVVLERAPAVGGMAASFTVGGVRVDHGSHRLHPSTDPLVLATLRALLGDELQERRRNGRLLLDGRWVAFPMRAGDLVRRLPPATAAAFAADAVGARFRHPRDATFAEAVRAGLGPAAAARFYGPYARKLWGRDAHELDAEHFRRRVGAATPGAVLRRIARRRGGRTFLYPAGGFGRIVERLADVATDAGATIRTSTAATAVVDGSVTTAAGDVVDAPQVWSTLPLPVLAALTGAPDEVRAAAARLTTRAMVLVYLVLDRERVTPFDAHYLPDPATPVSRVSEPKNYRDGDDPRDRTVLCAEIPGDVGDDRWRAPDDDLASLVVADLEARGLPPIPPVEVTVRRVPAAYPVYLPGWRDALTVVEAWVDGLRGVRSFGRHGLFAHDNTHHALVEAWAAAETLGDSTGWAAARERFRTHVVED